MQREMKIGILAILVIGLTSWGFQYLKGRNLFDNSLHLKTMVNDAQQIQVGAPIYYKGTSIGKVSDVAISANNQVTLGLNITNPKIEIPKSAIAEIYSEGIVQRKTAIELLFENGCDGRECAENGDLLRGRNRSLWNVVVQTVVSGLTELDTLGQQMSKELQENYNVNIHELKEEARKAMQNGAKSFSKEIKHNHLNLNIKIDSTGIHWEKK